MESGLRQAFSGQVVDQALYAAKQTVPDERGIHAFHSYFLHPGDTSKPIVYDVETLRNGKCFNARRFSALRHNKPILYDRLLLKPGDLLRTPEPNCMPDVPPQQGGMSELEITHKLANRLPENIRVKLLAICS